MVTVGISALADDLLGAAEDHVIDILLDEVLEHSMSHAPFFHLLQFCIIAAGNANFNQQLSWF